MEKDNGAGAGQDDGQPGDGAPGGGKSKDDPKDGNADGEFVPKRQFIAALNSATEKYEALAREFEAFKAGGGGKPQANDQPKRHSRAELKAAVTAEQITQEQADDIWNKQVKDEIREEAVAAAREDARRESQQERIDTDIAQYKRLEPEIGDKSSETFGKIREEFQYLVRNGSPNNVATELAAIRGVLGPLDKLEKAKSARRAAEHHEESGAGGDGKPNKSGKSLFDQLDSRKKAHYERLISQGQYKDKAAVEAELKYAKPGRQAGARA